MPAEAGGGSLVTQPPEWMEGAERSGAERSGRSGVEQVKRVKRSKRSAAD